MTQGGSTKTNVFFFSSRRRHTRSDRDWSSDVCSSDLLGQASVQAQPDGTITVSVLADDAGDPLHWREIGPLHYREVHGQSLLDFVADAQGHILYFATSDNPASILQRVPVRLSPSTFGPLLGITLVILLAALLAWAIGWGIRHRYGGTLVLARAQRITRLLSRLGVVACIAVAIGWFLFVAVISANELLLVRGGLTPWMYLLYALGVLALCGVLAVLANA